MAAAACSGEADPAPPKSQPSEQADAIASESNVAAQTAAEPCERDAAGQMACLIERFELESCDSATVLGSMFRANEADETYSYRTAYGLSSDCVTELKVAAERSSFRENDKGELIAKQRSGYRETLIIGLQVSPDGSVVEWERIQE